MKILEAMAGLALLLPIGTQADPAFESCARQTHGATMPTLHCLSQILKMRDAGMDAAYRQALAGSGANAPFLKRSQAAWLEFRDSWCEAGISRTGSLARIRLMQCRLEETKQRIAALQGLRQ